MFAVVFQQFFFEVHFEIIHFDKKIILILL